MTSVILSLVLPVLNNEIHGDLVRAKLNRKRRTIQPTFPPPFPEFAVNKQG
jgi:hypothetical protein